MNKFAETTPPLERKLAQALLLGRRVDADHLVLDDATLAAALDGSRPLRSSERAALLASPLTLRRFRQLVQSRAGAASWCESAGMLRAADSGGALSVLQTDDGHWSLHFVASGGNWQLVLKLDPSAPFAASLLGRGAVLAVRDGAGSLMLEGCLDEDGECEQAWPFAEAPAPHLQRHGAFFSVARAGVGPAPG